MAKYKLAETGVLDTETGSHIPEDSDNRHWREYQQWLDEGNAPDPQYTSEEVREQRLAGVIEERKRRLALGFNYDFGDARGVHRIGTTPADMAGWDEVTKLAQARNVAGEVAPIAIVTDTGPVDVSPAEWNDILLAAGEARQPIWQASFALQAMVPIPEDYAGDQHWP